MFFKKDKNLIKVIQDKINMKTNEDIINQKGLFGVMPRDIFLQCILFLDVKSLKNLVLTNSLLFDMVYKSPTLLSVRFLKQPAIGTFSQLHDKYINFLKAQHAREKANEKNAATLVEIAQLKESIKETESTLKAWKVSPHSPTCLTKEELKLTGIFTIVGLVGGAIFSCCFPWSCAYSILTGGAACAPLPVTVSRVTKCACGVCLSCDTEKLKELESNENTSNLDGGGSGYRR